MSAIQSLCDAVEAINSSIRALTRRIERLERRDADALMKRIICLEQEVSDMKVLGAPGERLRGRVED